MAAVGVGAGGGELLVLSGGDRGIAGVTAIETSAGGRHGQSGGAVDGAGRGLMVVLPAATRGGQPSRC